MACTVTIDSVVGSVPPNATIPTSIVVTGTASGCATGEIKVTIDCGTSPTSLSVPVDATGNWTASFGSNVGCPCEKPIRVRATCSDGTCEATTTVPLECRPSAPCPKISSFTVAVDGCAGTGASATVLFTVTLTPATSGCTYTWNFGDGSPPVTTSVPSVTHAYSGAGTFTALVVVNCPSQGDPPCITRATAQVVVPPCDGGCPTVVGLTATVSGCAGPGSATVAFNGTLVPATPGCVFLWAFGDGTNATTATPSVSHVYSAPNTYAVAVTAICPNVTPCATTTLAVTVPRCCPVVTNILGNVEDSECADGMGKSATFNFSAITDPSPAAGNYDWDFGDGTPTVTNPGPNATHDYAAPGTYTVSVVYVPDPALHPSCPPSSFSISTVDVPACPGGGGGGGGGGNGGGGEGFGCFGLRAIMTIAAILAVVALALAACIPPAASTLLVIAAAFGAAAAIAGAIWGIFCKKPCAWALLLAWQVAIGAGFLLLCFTTCCPSFWPIGIGLVVVGAGLMLLWKQRCHKNRCQVLKELVLAMSGVLIPLLGWLGAIPILTPCINHVVTGALSLLAGALTVAALNCIP